MRQHTEMLADESWASFLRRSDRDRRNYDLNVYPIMRIYLAALLKLGVDSWPTNAEMLSYFGPFGAHTA